MAIEEIRDSNELSEFVKPNNTATPIANKTVDPFILELICKMIITDNKMIRRTQLINIQKYIDKLPSKEFFSDDKIKRYIDFIRRGLDARINFNLTDPSMIMHHINDPLSRAVQLAKGTYNENVKLTKNYEGFLQIQGTNKARAT